MDSTGKDGLPRTTGYVGEDHLPSQLLLQIPEAEAMIKKLTAIALMALTVTFVFGCDRQEDIPEDTTYKEHRQQERQEEEEGEMSGEERGEGIGGPPSEDQMGY